MSDPITLAQLWSQLAQEAPPDLLVAITYYTPQVESLSDQLPAYQHHEYPKWVDGVLVEAPQEDTGAMQEPAGEPKAESSGAEDQKGPQGASS